MNIANLVVTFVLGVAGLFISASWYRDRQLRIAEERLSAYRRLWTLTEVARPTRMDPGGQGPLTRKEAGTLHETLTGWYYEKGQGMLLTLATRDMYLEAKKRLLTYSLASLPDDPLQTTSMLDREMPWSQGRDEPAEAFKAFRCYVESEPEARPEALTEGPRALSEWRIKWNWDARSAEWDEGARRIRELSLLRTQLKLDLDIFGFTYWRERTRSDEDFLTKASFNAERWGRMSWYRRLPRRVFGRWYAHKA
jgi:hypothetical protein